MDNNKVNNEQIKFYCQEHKLLREELNNLKECQVRYFTFSLTATGIVLGIIAKFGSTYFPNTLFLLPLTFLIPSWWVFFDKAKTITRIVAYYRLLETIILNEESSIKEIMLESKKFKYIGWENSLMFFREWETGEGNKDTNDVAEDFNFEEWIKIPLGSYWLNIFLFFWCFVGMCPNITFWHI